MEDTLIYDTMYYDTNEPVMNSVFFVVPSGAHFPGLKPTLLTKTGSDTNLGAVKQDYFKRKVSAFGITAICLMPFHKIKNEAFESLAKGEMILKADSGSGQVSDKWPISKFLCNPFSDWDVPDDNRWTESWDSVGRKQKALENAVKIEPFTIYLFDPYGDEFRLDPHWWTMEFVPTEKLKLGACLVGKQVPLGRPPVE